jgi:glutamyl-tRNA reductase
LKYAPIENLDNELRSADIVLVSTNSAQPVIFRKHLEGAGEKLVIDLSVPCNVASDAQELPCITFVDVDMLSRINDETLQKRIAEVPKAVAIIEEHMAEFEQWYNMRRHVPVLKEVKNKLKEIYIDPVLLGHVDQLCPINDSGQDEKIQKVINTLAAKIRKDNTPGCNYIQAINEFIA